MYCPWSSRKVSRRRIILGDRPGAGIMSIARSDDGEGATLCDTTHESEFWLLLFDAIARGRSISGRHGAVEPHRTDAFARLEHGPHAAQAGTDGKPHSRAHASRSVPVVLEVSVHGGEQSNTSAVIGNRMIFKMFRRIGEGENPDLEIGRYLTEQDATGVCAAGGWCAGVSRQERRSLHARHSARVRGQPRRRLGVHARRARSIPGTHRVGAVELATQRGSAKRRFAA